MSTLRERPDDSAPDVRPWADRPSLERELPHRRPPESYQGFRDYFEDVIEPTLRRREPQVQIGYPHLKRRG